MVKSHGKHRRTRDLFRKISRLTVNKFLKRFETGDRVAIVIESGSSKGQPFRRFQGKTGRVVGMRGKSYMVEFKDGGKMKKIITRPEHLKAL